MRWAIVRRLRLTRLSPSIEVAWLVAGDHDLKPLKVSGFTHEQHLASAAQKVAEFLKG